MPYSSEKYLDLFDRKIEDTNEEKLQELKQKNKGVLLYRVKTIKSGKMLECEIYPLWKHKTDAARAKRKSGTRKAQANLNDKNAKKNIIRKINANFTEQDIIIGLSYKGPPPDEKQAREDIQKYIKDIRKYRRKNGLPEMKYIYVMEFEDGPKKKRIHHHIIMSSMDRDIAEKLWGKGYANSRRLQPDEFGLEGLARYIIKDPKGKKRWASSKNLDKPDFSIADHKVSKRQTEKLAKDENEAMEIFEKLYKGYTFNDIKVKYSDFLPGAYLYVRMRSNSS